MQHLAWHGVTTLVPHTALETSERRWGTAEEGATQGDPVGSPWFGISWHKYVRRLDAAVAAHGGMARFGADDGYCLEVFEWEIRDHCALHLAREKIEIFPWDGNRPPGCLPGLKQVGVMVGDTFQPGIMVYGCPCGMDSYVEHTLVEKVEELAQRACESCSVLGDENQALWTTLRASLSHTFDFWLKLVHPTQIQAAAERVDALFWGVLEMSVGCAIPRTWQSLGYETVVDVPVAGLRGQSFQAWVAGCPSARVGWG